MFRKDCEREGEVPGVGLADFLQRLPAVHDVLRPAGEVGDRDLVGVEADAVVEGGEDLTEVDGAVVG